MPYKTKSSPVRLRERGNMLFMILIAIVLIGLLTAAIMGSGDSESSNIDKEELVIKASEVQRYASELERAVLFITQNGKSETEIRFAHPDAHADYGDLSADADPTDQVFSPQGGAARYRDPPADINDGSAWEFYGSSRIPGAGSNEADLVAVLPNVTEQFCEKINEINGQPDIPVDNNTGDGATVPKCVYGGSTARFDGGQQFYSTTDINVLKESEFTQDPTISAARPALEACVYCESDTNWHYYHVLMAR